MKRLWRKRKTLNEEGCAFKGKGKMKSANVKKSGQPQRHKGRGGGGTNLFKEKGGLRL